MMKPEQIAEKIETDAFDPGYYFGEGAPGRININIVVDIIRQAIDAEREACALAAEAQGTWVHDKPYEMQVDMRARIAAAIRARKD